MSWRWTKFYYVPLQYWLGLRVLGWLGLWEAAFKR